MENRKPRLLSRRDFMNRLLASGVVMGGVSLFGKKLFAVGSRNSVRRFHISMQAEAWKTNPELTGIMKEAGISDVGMGSYLQGKWYQTPKELIESTDFKECTFSLNI